MQRRTVIRAALSIAPFLAVTSTLEAHAPVDEALTQALATAQAGGIFGAPIVTPVGERDLLVVADADAPPVTIYILRGTPVHLVRVDVGGR